MYVVIYDKKNLSIIARPTITTLEEFKGNPVLFYPDWDIAKHIWDETEFKNPVLENGDLRESTKEELYKAGKYILSSNEIVENGKIKTIKLSEFEYIEDNKIKLNRNKKIESIKEKLDIFKTQYSEKEFIFKDEYVQKNRELDKNNLNSIVTMLMFSGKDRFEGWKFKDKQGNDVYVTLMKQDIVALSDIMTAQTTKAMHTESKILKKLDNLTDDELKEFNVKEEFEKEWNKI